MMKLIFNSELLFIRKMASPLMEPIVLLASIEFRSRLHESEHLY